MNATPSLRSVVDRLRMSIQNLSPAAEFCLIICLAFGPFMPGQFWNAIQGKHFEITTAGIVAYSLAELLILIPVFWVAKARGLSFATFGCRISWKGTAGGVLLFLVAYGVCIGVSVGAHMIHPEPPPYTVGHLAVLPIILISIVNPVWEELLETGYFIYSLERFGMWPAVMASAVFRGLWHIHFGVNAALGVFAFGVVMGLAYWRWRQLWPLIVAHSLADALVHLYASYRAA